MGNDKSQPKLSGPAEERYPLTVAGRPWEKMRAFWGESGRVRVLAWMTGVERSSAYKYLEEFGDFGSGRKSDLHRACEQVEYAVTAADDAELAAVREMDELPLLVYERALVERQMRDDPAGVGDARLFDELMDVIRARSHGRLWGEQRREMVQALVVLEREIRAGDRREGAQCLRPAGGGR